MIVSTWPFLAILLLAAGLFPVLEAHRPHRVFEVMPPIVLTYLLVTALAVGGAWQASPEIVATQKLLIARLLPALMFLLLVTCDLRAILALGPRVLGTFACATLSILTGFVLTYLLLRHLLPPDGWQALSAVAGSWIGGTANLVAVKEALGMDERALSNALLTDALCYSVWVLILFSTAPLAARFNRWAGAVSSVERLPRVRGDLSPSGATTPGHVLLWLALGIAVGLATQALAARLPSSGVLGPTSWALLLATAAGLGASFTPLRRLPGSLPTASALLALVVAVMASQGSFAGLAAAPLFVLAGACVLAIHAGLMLLAARLFRFDLALCGIASLANIGGVASAPLLAALHSPALAPVGVLLAMLGYLLGTGGGLALASLLQRLAPGG